MKRLLSIILLIAMSLGAVFAQQPAASFCHIVITGDFDSECFYNFKDEITDEYPNLMIACKRSTVTYTAYADLGGNTPSGYIWEIYGDVTHSTTGNAVTVEWGSDMWGYVVVTVVDGLGDTCTEFSRVRLIDKPTVGSTTVPAYVTRTDGSRVIRVCKGSTVQFIDHSTASGSDIAGYLWDYDQGIQTSTPNFTIDNIQAEGVVTHRVYNNCGCYDEETYDIELLEGDVLELDCFGTVCKDAIVHYTAQSPTCQDYSWYVEGGTLVDGQGTSSPTVQWDHPADGYGVIGLDGVVCGNLVCPTLMSLKVPVIHDGLTIRGETNVCVGEAVLYSLPLFGSTEYSWTVTPLTGVDTSMKTGGSELRLAFNQQGTYKLACRYRCDFLDCGPYRTDSLTIVVKPSLTIVGADQICVTNACSLAVTPAVSATWKAYDLANGNAVAATGTGSTFSHTFSHAGRYLVTASHLDYCTEASFVLNVRATPPAPTVADLDPMNRHTACLYSSAALAGTPSQPNYMLVWEPVCATATPQTYSGDSVTISYLGEVCDVRVYNYDMVLQCQSADYYVHTMDEFEPLPMNIPPNITVCPGTVITWDDNNVPDQSFEGMLYEWSIEQYKQYCASVQGSQFDNNITLAVNNITTPVTFTVALERRYCGNMHADTIIPITVGGSSSPLTITGPDPVCQYDDAVYTGSGGNASSYSWSVENAHYSGASITHSFEYPGTRTVTLKGHTYTYCNNTDYWTSATKQVHVNPLPQQCSLEYVSQDGRIYLRPAMSTTDYTFTWWYEDNHTPPITYVLGDNYIPAQPPQPTPRTYYCTVTDQITGCSSTCSLTLDLEIPPAPCETMHFTSYYNFCDSKLTLISNNYPSVVIWTLPPGCQAIQHSGFNNREVEIQFNDVGYYTITARSGFFNCYEGEFTKAVEFMPDFSFEPNCNRITVVNNSRYIPLARTLYIRVTNDCNNNEDIIQMPEGLATYTYTPTVPTSGVCTYTFTLKGYGANNNINPPCVLGDATIGSSAITPTLTITTANTVNPNATCNNTPIKLTAQLDNPYTITSSNWSFGDGSTFNTSGDNIYHTFGAPSSYNITASVVDNYGCTRTSATPLSILSMANTLYSGKVELTSGADKCPNGSDYRDIYFDLPAIDNHYSWWRHKDLTRRPSIYYNHYYTYRTDDYFVYVINDNYCQKEASKHVTFLNAPTAIIYADNFNCCEGDEITLYGQQGPSDNTITYSWEIRDANNTVLQTSTNPNITFTAPQGTGLYTVELTVEDDNTHCSSTATETITVNSKPAAPTLAFTGSPCISDAPVQIAATGFTGEMHWNNGNTGTPAEYYTHGMASAYYYDPAIGCASDTAKIRIDRQPDFDALLTGCYEKCSDFFDYYLPVWGLTDDGQEVDWRWRRNGTTVAAGHGDYYRTPLLLPLQNYGSYRLDVNYSGINCMDQSPLLTIGSKEVCDCDSIEVTYTRDLIVGHCELYYDVEVTICNNHKKRAFCADGIDLVLNNHNVSIDNTDFTARTIAAGDCYTFSMTLQVLSLEPSVASFSLVDESCLYCEKIFSIDLMPDIECLKDMELDEMTIVDGLSSGTTAYFNFTCLVGTADAVLAFWTEPPMVVDWLFYSAGTVSGLGMIDMARLSQLVYNNSEICFYAIVCNDDELCKKYVCIKAADLYDLIVDAGVEPGFSKGSRKDGGMVAVPAAPYLKPNPTTGKVTVTGAASGVVEVVVMDMNGRKLAVFADTETFNMHSHPSGSYIVRVSTKDGKLTYHKLIKQ